MPGLLQTLAIMAFQSSLSSVLMMSSLLGDSFLVTKLFRLSVYYVSCFPLLLVRQIFPLNICFSDENRYFQRDMAIDQYLLFSTSALFMYPKIIVVFFWWFWVRIFCIQQFPLLLCLTSFQSMIFSLFLWCTTFLLLQVFFLGFLSVSSIHIHAEGWNICRLSKCWFWCKFWDFTNKRPKQN